MKRLYLMRHGHAPSTQDAGVKTDALRPLSAKGAKDADRAAREILRRGGRPSIILHSPLARAAQTARTAALALGIPTEEFLPLDNTLPGPETFAALNRRAADATELLAVGHQPQVGELSAMIADFVFDFRPAGVVAIELSPAPRVLWAVNPDELDRP